MEPGPSQPRAAAAGRNGLASHPRFSLSTDDASDSSRGGAAYTPTGAGAAARARGAPSGPLLTAAAGASAPRRNLFSHMRAGAPSAPRRGAAPAAATARQSSDSANDSSGWGSPRGSFLPAPLRFGPSAPQQGADSPLARARPQQPALPLLPSALNADGSFNVVGDDDDADGSGLMGFTAALLPPREQRGGGGLRPGPPPAPRKGKTREPPPSRATQRQPVPAADESMASIIIHSEGDEEANGASEGPAQDVDAAAATADDDEAQQRQRRLLARMRLWREDAANHFLFDTAIFWGDKVLCLETGQTAWNDAYHLAKAYFLSHRYAQAEHLLTTPLRFGSTSHRRTAASSNGAPEAAADAEMDPLAAALAATRSSSQLPASMLARSGAPGVQAGVPAAQWHGAHEAAQLAEANSSAAPAMQRGLSNGKRKERGFTVSGTGTGSESSGANGEEEELEDPRGGPRFKWAEEQRETLKELRTELLPPPDGPSLVTQSSVCRWLAAQCMVRQGKLYEALDTLSGGKDDAQEVEERHGIKAPSADGGIKLSSSKWFLRGQIHLRLDDSEAATQAFMRALALDVKNYDAFSALVEARLLGAAEQWAFVQTLEYVAQAGEAEEAKEGHELIRLLYTSRLDKEGAAHAAKAAEARRSLLAQYDLSQNADVLLGLAEELFAQLRFDDAFLVTSRILALRVEHEATLPLHISVLFHLPAQRPALFLLAHHLADAQPSLPASWYAVGMWYAAAQRWAEARRFFSKAVHLDPRFCAAWIAFAHSFALEGETEQAVTSYSTAARHFPQSHVPKLFIGMEYIAQGNLLLAKLFLEGSHALFEHDPLCFNERGVVAFYEKDYESAITHFRTALELAHETQEPASAWVSTQLNLGLAYRRAGRLEQATFALRRVLELSPLDARAHAALGAVAHAQGQIDAAVGWYHASLALRAGDEATTALLELALQENATAAPLSHGLQELREEEEEREEEGEEQGWKSEQDLNASLGSAMRSYEGMEESVDMELTDEG